MRLIAFFLAAALVLIAACERKPSEPSSNAGGPVSPAATQAASVSVSAPVSDELPGLPAPATGIAFWDHPTLSFNGVMIVATDAGIISYSMEDGAEVSRIDGFKADGVATGYLGLGAKSAGFIAFLDSEESAFRFYGVDNASRAFLPLDPGPAIRGAVRGFCLGRGAGATAPSLFVIQKGEIQVFNLAASAGGVKVESEAHLDAPDNLVSCTVDIDGVLLAAADDGDIYKLDGDHGFTAPFARTAVSGPGGLAILAAAKEDDPMAVSGLILLAGLAKGEIHVFNRETGAALGAVTLAATDDLPAVGAADVFAATGANLGALYRNGVLAFGVAEGEDGPVIRIAPASTIKNALSLPMGEPASPRGMAPEAENSLIIPIVINPN